MVGLGICLHGGMEIWYTISNPTVALIPNPTILLRAYYPSHRVLTILPLPITRPVHAKQKLSQCRSYLKCICLSIRPTLEVNWYDKENPNTAYCGICAIDNV